MNNCRIKPVNEFLEGRKQLLKGTYVLCKKDIQVHPDLFPGSKILPLAFKEGMKYYVYDGNTVVDGFGHRHTFSVGFFVEYFEELPSCYLNL